MPKSSPKGAGFPQALFGASSMYKEVSGAAALLLTFWLFIPYIRSIRSGETKPHFFTWVIWAAGTLIVFAAQSAGGGGLGAWVIGVSGCITSYVALLAYRHRSDLSITTGDLGCLVAALTALPLWFMASDPLAVVVVLTSVDLVGFGPTVRAAYHRPHDERIWFYGLGAIRNALVIVALEHYSATTVLFPAAIGLACLLLASFIAYRRALVGRLIS